MSGISSAAEAETRATSALLAVLTIVRGFNSTLLTPLGASAARRATVEAFIETKFKLADGTQLRPDGLIQVTYGSKKWKAIVEVKTGDSRLEADQLTSYLTLAREQGLDAVLTLSNAIAIGDQHPCEGVKVRANSKVRLAHYPWSEILAVAIRTKVHEGVPDRSQDWVLGELIRYLEHPASGVAGLTDMGANWTSARDAARAGTLNRVSPEARDIAERWEQIVRYATIQLGAQVGADVTIVAPKTQVDPKARMTALVESLSENGTLDATIRVPGAAGPLTIAADLRARQLAAYIEIGAPTDRGARARVSWMLQQLGDDTPTALTIEALARNARAPISLPLTQAREERDNLIDPEGRDLLRFRLILRTEMGGSRRDGGRTAGFIESVTGLIDAFYRDVVQQITPWTAKAPKAKGGGRATTTVVEAIEDKGDLVEAIDAAREVAAEETGNDPPPRRQPPPYIPGQPYPPPGWDHIV